MEKSGTGPQTGLQFRRLPVQPERGKGQTHTRVLADPNHKDIRFAGPTNLSAPAIDVPHRATDSHRKTSPPRWTPYEVHNQIEKQLEGTRITRKCDPHSQVAPPPI